MRTHLALLIVLGCSSRSATTTPDAAPPANDAAADGGGVVGAHCAPLSSYGGGGFNPDHPRLELLGSDLATLRARVTSDSLVQGWYATLYALGQQQLTEPPPIHDLQTDSTKAMRAIMDRVTNLAGLYVLAPDRNDPTVIMFRDRALADALAVSDPAQFPDWYHCDKMLSVAELAFGVAIVYDWLYDQLTPAQRETIAGALARNALTAAAEDYAYPDQNKTDPNCKTMRPTWLQSAGNQSEVDNGGLLVAALAVGGPNDPLRMTNAAVIDAVIARAPHDVLAGLAAYAQDGGWHEGPGYWDYGTRYLSHLIASANTALGTDFNLPDAIGLAQTGVYRIHVTGPTGNTFNFADVGAAVSIGNEESFWLARQYDDPRQEVDAVQRAQHPATDASYSTSHHDRYDTSANLDIFDLIRYDPTCANATVADLPLGAMFRGAEVATMRTSWTDPNALYVAVKAGDNSATHVHYDTGQFVFDMAGQRFAIDLGDDAYSLPGYFGDQRPTYYRTRTEGHNTLSINTQAQQPLKFANQDPTASAMQIVAFQSAPDLSYAVADLTAAYTGRVTGVSGGLDRVQRGIAIVGGNQILVDDEIASPVSVETMWSFHTQATPSPGSSLDRVTLTQNATSIEMRVIEPAGATFVISSADPSALGLGDARNGWNPDGTCAKHGHVPQCVYNVYLRVPVTGGTPARVAVRFAADSNTPLPTLPVLADWIAAAPVNR